MNRLVFDAIVFLPLLSSLLLLLFGKKLKEKGTSLLSGSFLFGSMILSWLVFFLHRPLLGKGGGEAGHDATTNIASDAVGAASDATATASNTAADAAT
ncbi:MAG: hypothetical protein QM529_03155, partial [Hydrotalea sp.]|nr:hypothetical protein [Hydrotalea sp.]